MADVFIMTNFRPQDMPNAKKAAPASKPAAKKQKPAPKVVETTIEDAQTSIEAPLDEPAANSVEETE